MKLRRYVLVLVGILAVAVACQQTRPVQSTAALKRAYWGLPSAGGGADVTSMVTCPNGFPCDAFANAASYSDSRPDSAKKLTVIWTCEPQRFVLSEVVAPGLKVRMDCIGGAPLRPRTIGIIDASWGTGGPSTVDVTQAVRDICGDNATRCQVPAMGYIFGAPDRSQAPRTLRIRFTCNGQTTPGQQAIENSVADLRCEQAADLNKQ